MRPCFLPLLVTLTGALTLVAQAQSASGSVGVRVSIPDFSALRAAQTENAVSTFGATGSEPYVMVGMPATLQGAAAGELVLYSRSDSEAVARIEQGTPANIISVREQDRTSTAKFTRQTYSINTDQNAQITTNSTALITISTE